MRSLHSPIFAKQSPYIGGSNSVHLEQHGVLAHTDIPQMAFCGLLDSLLEQRTLEPFVGNGMGVPPFVTSPNKRACGSAANNVLIDKPFEPTR